MIKIIFSKRIFRMRKRASQTHVLVSFFFFFFLSQNIWLFLINIVRCALFMDPQISLFSNIFIKNRSHGIIHTFKNYFATVFFSFQLYPNGTLVWTSMLKAPIVCGGEMGVFKLWTSLLKVPIVFFFWENTKKF